MELYINATDPRNKAEVGFFDGSVWQCEKRERPEVGGVLKIINDYLKDKKIKLTEVRTLFVLMGQGSFTATRTVTTTANMLAFALGVKVVGLESFNGQTPAELLNSNPAPSKYVLPKYSAPARIGPKKV